MFVGIPTRARSEIQPDGTGPMASTEVVAVPAFSPLVTCLGFPLPP